MSLPSVSSKEYTCWPLNWKEARVNFPHLLQAHFSCALGECASAPPSLVLAAPFWPCSLSRTGCCSVARINHIGSARYHSVTSTALSILTATRLFILARSSAAAGPDVPALMVAVMRSPPGKCIGWGNLIRPVVRSKVHL